MTDQWLDLFAWTARAWHWQPSEAFALTPSEVDWWTMQALRLREG